MDIQNDRVLRKMEQKQQTIKKQNNMEIKNLIQAVYLRSSDRIIYTEYNLDGDLIGLNFAQGGSTLQEVGEFKQDYMKNNPRLLRFHNEFKDKFKLSEYLNDVQVIDIMIWNFVQLEEFFFDNER